MSECVGGEFVWLNSNLTDNHNGRGSGSDTAAHGMLHTNRTDGTRHTHASNLQPDHTRPREITGDSHGSLRDPQCSDDRAQCSTLHVTAITIAFGSHHRKNGRERSE